MFTRRTRTWLSMFGLIGALSLTCGVRTVQGAPPKDAAPTQAPAQQKTEQMYQQLELFTDALSIVSSEYVEPPDPQKLMYGALKGMLASLDPYSQFMDPDAYKELKVETGGEFGGLGIEITIKDNLLTVITPIDGTPAYKAGIKAGDKIVKIDGESTQDITLLDAVKKLRGKPGTSVTLTIFRESESKVKEIAVTRDIIKIESIREAKMVDPAAHIGYVRISEFQEKTPKDLVTALQQLESQNMEGLVLDLRNNPGGLLDVAVAVGEQFIPEHEMIVSTAGRIKSQNMEFRSRGSRSQVTVPVVVLVNEGSASASEIVAGALQDHHRGIVLGTKSFGKGSVQTVIPMRDGSALRLTTSKYYTPSGRSIHGQGIMPDVVVEPMQLVSLTKEKQGADALLKEMDKAPEKSPAPETPANAKDNNKDGKEKNGKKGDEEPAYDNQLARAVDVLKGLHVYQHAKP